MNTQEIVTLLRVYADEPDETFMSNPLAALYCKQGYDQFRNFIAEVNPYAISRTQNITMTDQQTYDLTQAGVVPTLVGTPSLLGPNPDAVGVPLGRLTRLLNVYLVNANGQVIQVFDIVNNETAMIPGRWVCSLEGTTLRFSYAMSGIIQLVYTHEQTIGRIAGAANNEPTWVDAAGAIPLVNLDDNMQIYHDLIPLMAMNLYAIQDGADNIQSSNQLTKRKDEFRDYLQQRNYSGVHYVHYNYQPNDPGTQVIV